MLAPKHPRLRRRKSISQQEKVFVYPNYRHYVNLLVDYPFGIKTKEQFDIENAKKVLDEDHYGMKKVKQRILEFMAVSKLKGEFKCNFINKI